MITPMPEPNTPGSVHDCACDTPGCGCGLVPCIQIRQYMTDDSLTSIMERRDRNGLCIYCGRHPRRVAEIGRVTDA